MKKTKIGREFIQRQIQEHQHRIEFDVLQIQAERRKINSLKQTIAVCHSEIDRLSELLAQFPKAKKRKK